MPNVLRRNISLRRSFGIFNKNKKSFEETCQCDLQLIGAGDGAALLARVQLEGKQTEADVVLGLDTNLTARAKETGLFTKHNKILNLNLPISWNDDTFIPFDWGYFSFVYNSEKVTSAPKNFIELAKRSDLKIVIQDPRSSTPGLGLLMWLKAAYGDEASKVWKGLAPNILTVTKGWSEAYGLFMDGEAELVLSYKTSPAYHIIAENDFSIKAAIFDEGHYMQIEVAGKVLGSGVERLSRWTPLLMPIPREHSHESRRFHDRRGNIFLRLQKSFCG
mgnify:CR=1 FL=1